MRRTLLIVTIVCLAGGTLLPNIIHAQEPPPPHIDPATVTGIGELDALSLFGYFGTIFSLLESGSYGDVRVHLDQLRHANFPDDLRFLIERYEELLGQLNDSLDTTEQSLGIVSDFIDQGQRAEALEYLINAQESVDRARSLLIELRAATEVVGLRLGALGAALDSPLHEAFERLQSPLDRLQALWTWYSWLLEELSVIATLPGGEAISEPRLSGEVATPGQGALEEPILEVLLVTPQLSVRSRVFSFLPRRLKISGNVTSELGPLQNASVTLELGDRSQQVKTDDQGKFSGSITPPLTRLLLGPQTLVVTVDPEEPWSRSVSQEVSLFIVNVANLGILSLVLSYLGAALFLTIRRRRMREGMPSEGAKRITEDIDMEDGPPQTIEAAAPAWSITQLGRSQNLVIAAYFSSVRFLEASRAVSMQPYFTLRDFLSAIGERMGNAFPELTAIAERALYAAHALEDSDVVRAEELAARVVQEGV